MQTTLRKASCSREKSIQTDYTPQMDEAIQVSDRKDSSPKDFSRKDSGSTTDWLHSVTKPLADIAEVIDVELSAASARSLPSPLDSGIQVPVPANANVIRQIEDLENDIEHFLQAARFRTSEPEPEPDQQVFTSPGYPSYYPNNAVSTWSASTTSGNVLSISFTSFDTEAGYDFLRVSVFPFVKRKTDF